MLGKQSEPGQQLNIFSNTPAPSEEMLMEQERDAVAKKYGVLNPNALSFQMGKWYIGTLTVEEWAGVNSKDEEYWKN